MGKRPISATIDEKLIKWINEQLKSDTMYRNKSHLIETALNKLYEGEKKNKN